MQAITTGQPSSATVAQCGAGIVGRQQDSNFALAAASSELSSCVLDSGPRTAPSGTAEPGATADFMHTRAPTPMTTGCSSIVPVAIRNGRSCACDNTQDCEGSFGSRANSLNKPACIADLLSGFLALSDADR